MAHVLQRKELNTIHFLYGEVLCAIIFHRHFLYNSGHILTVYYKDDGCMMFCELS